MITVKLPNGATAQFPDGTPQDVMTKAIQAKFPPTGATATATATPEAAEPQATQPPAGAPSFLGSALATVNHAVTDLPVVGPALQWAGDNLAAQTVGRMSGQDPAAWLQEAQASRAANDAANPIAAALGGIGGNIAAFGGAGAASDIAANALGLAGRTGARMLSSGLSTAAISAADNMARGQSPVDAMQSSIGPGLVGAAIPGVGHMLGGAAQAATDTINHMRQAAATSGAIAAAPDSAALKAISSDLFNKVDQSGVTIDTPKFSQFVKGVVSNAKGMGIDPTLDPKATAAYQRLIGALNDVQSTGNPLKISDIHTLRQIAQSAATSSEGRDQMFANQIVKGLDGFVTSPGAAIIPPGASKDAPNNLMQAISTWGRAKRVGLIEEAITQAQTMASGPENGLRLKFQQILRNPQTRNLFSGAEQQAIRDVANGTPSVNAMRFLGRFGFSKNNWLGSMLGGTGAFGATTALTGNPILGSLAAAGTNALGTFARSKAADMGMANAERAAQVVATPNIPSLAPRQLPQLLQGGVPSLQLLLRSALMDQQATQ